MFFLTSAPEIQLHYTHLTNDFSTLTQILSRKGEAVYPLLSYLLNKDRNEKKKKKSKKEAHLWNTMMSC